MSTKFIKYDPHTGKRECTFKGTLLYKQPTVVSDVYLTWC